MGKDNKTDMTETPHDAAADPQQIIAELQRNLNERTAERDESLTYQTAISNVLNVISRSPSDIQPVLDTIAETAQQLCESEHAYIFRFDGDKYHLVAARDVRAERIAFLKDNPIVPNRGSTVGRIALELRPVHVMDALADSQYKLSLVGHGGRTILGVPLLRDGIAIGVIVLTRGVVRPFVERQIQLVSTFADQALIAIENVRLFDEVQAKTRDLSEALIYQTGSSNILGVIASSPTDVGPVLMAIVDSACDLCDAVDAIVLLKDGNSLWTSAHHGSIPLDMERWPISRKWVAGRAFLDQKPVHVRDLLSADGDEFPETRQRTPRTGTRSILSVPLLSEGKSIGTIVLRRTEVHPFSNKQITLLQTFADQAVIAIGNVRLFDEVQAKTRDLTELLQQQTATSEVLKVISSSPGELKPVFHSMLENAVSICDAKFGNLFLIDGDCAHWEAGVGTPRKLAQYFSLSKLFRPTPGSHLDRVMRTKQVSHTADDTAEAVVGAAARLGGARSTVCVPMVKDEALVGTIFIYRTEVRPFTDKQIDLVKNFAAQAVIAIENTRLLNELRQRTDDLTQSLEDLRTAQDRLVQTEKLASLGQLTAGIAHEIKNPLNFVNNFSALSAELIEEMKDMLSDVSLDKNKRKDLDEITQMLKSNLDKVVQHGKRADSIVKNMLLHSRQGSGEHRPVDINAIVDESLNLAYHGARAENTGFNITMHRSFDPAVGMADGYPQEITRALLNLISNGFYAATKRKSDAGDGFEPTLTATTRNLGDKVEIRIRDNGTGIPAEVKEKIFNPFFTTKPAGEGTGLGLSMSHDIIVKQHGGRIEVETELGQFTEFRIVLPRAGGSLIKPGERS
jgi:signal transduction histidine kinase